MIKGIKVTLMVREQTSIDPFGKPVYQEIPVIVDNVLIAPVSDAEVLETYNLTGRKAIYTLGIPKGDAHNWEDRKVLFFGQEWHTIGMPLEGIEEMIPLRWNKKVRVERYGGQAED